MSKLIEKVILAQLSNHLLNNNLYNANQSAYRVGHSTETALMKVVNDLLLALDKKKVSVLTLLDLSCAFDTIDHDILLSRLEHVFGITGTALCWFKSYLSNRTQTVCINNHCSDSEAIVYGVPQGSVLGPVLFVLYTAPLSDVVALHSAISHSFADDTQLHKSSDPSDVSTLVKDMESCITDVKFWMTKNKLKLNDDKTEVLVISSPRLSLTVPLPESVTVGNTTVKCSNSAKNLGVILDSHLTMQKHVMTVIRNVNFELRRISSIRHFLTTEATKTLVSAFVLSLA